MQRSLSVPEKHTAEKGLRSLAVFSGDVSPRDYYARENATLVEDKADDILRDRDDNLPKGAARNVALSELWNELTDLEKNHWKDRAHAITDDVAR